MSVYTTSNFAIQPNSGNICIGHRFPYNWTTTYHVAQLGLLWGDFYSSDSGYAGIATNLYNDGTQWINKGTNVFGPSPLYEQNAAGATFTWYISTGTLGTTATLTTLQILDPSGLTVGYTSNSTSLLGAKFAVNGGVRINGILTATTFVGNMSGTASVATNIASGSQGQIAYQSAAGTTAFVSSGTTGQFLQATTNGAPTWTSTGSMQVGYAKNILGNGAGNGSLLYQSAADTTSFLGQGSAGWILVTGGLNSTATWTSTATIYVNGAVNAQTLFGGVAGSIHYQSAAGVTAFTSGTTGQILVATTNGAPVYTNTGSIYVNRAVIADSASGSAGSVANSLTAGTGLTGTAFNGSAAQTWTLNTATLMASSVNIVGGLKDQIPYQSAVGVTTFSTGLTFNGTIFTATNIIVPGTTTATSTTTGALQVIGGVGIGGNIMVRKSISAGTASAGADGEIRASNEITAYFSDRRLKENVQIINNAVVKVLSLTGITYTPNDLAESFGYDKNKKIAGLFADEVDAVLPEAVRPAPFDDDGSGGSKSGEYYQTIQYEKIVPLLVEAIKELKQEIEILKKRYSSEQNT
jgi:hypothetical protein